ncbi:stromal interaction molecule [Arctopsyche grandis]|uniref:stromal interaction molecule n=1 Tax=Arctopsyche grandis TaxID=121162 RepID=UPI00406D8DC7
MRVASETSSWKSWRSAMAVVVAVAAAAAAVVAGADSPGAPGMTMSMSMSTTTMRPRVGFPGRQYSLMAEAADSRETAPSSSSVCGENDLECLSKNLSDSDRHGLEAIHLLHRQLDDDANGNVDLSESDDFLREELQYDSGYERRQQAFHYNDDTHISAKELWEAWRRSEVHNWTIEQTTEWLEKNVELPQYMKTFVQNKVTGATLPRLAVHNMQYLSGTLGIKDPIHKQKIALKAMDVVLFGPPKDSGHGWKDGMLIALIVGAIVGCWWAYQQSRASRRQLGRMLKDMESLRKAELALDDLQKELERARLEQENVTTEKQNLEQRLLEAGNAGVTLATSYSDLEVSHLKAEIELLRSELQRAEGELEDRCWAPPPGLQLWLQLTHELENKSYLRKKHGADLQLQTARDACEKLRKKRSSLVGAFVSTHGKSIDDVDRSIVEARTSLNEVTQELQERVHRWKQMEMLCGFNIINNNGLPYLENVLYRNVNGRPNKLRATSSQDDLDLEDSGSLYGGISGTVAGSGTAGHDPMAVWKEDSSGSEELDPPEGRHYPMDLRLAEARIQLEERRALEEKRAQELRSQYLDRVQEYKNYVLDKSPTSDLPNSTQDINNSVTDVRSLIQDSKIASNGKLKEAPIQFTLGGDNVNWTGEDLSPTNSVGMRIHSKSQPQLTRSRGGTRYSQLPPRRPPSLPSNTIMKSQSTEAGLEECGVDSPSSVRSNNATFNRLSGSTRQRTIAAEVDTGSSSSEQSLSVSTSENAVAAAISASQPSVNDVIEPRGRRRKIHFPFTKKSKAHSVNSS